MRVLLIFLFLLAVASTPAAPLELVTSVPLERARSVTVAGQHLWVSQNFHGAALFDLHDPAAPRLVRKFSPQEMQPVYLKPLPADNLLLSADRFQGLVIYDVSTPDRPTTVSALPLTGMTTYVDVTQTTSGRRLALLARTGQGLLSVDISDVTSPTVVDQFTSGVEFTQTLALADGLVYAADGEDGGLKVLRLTADGHFEPLYQANLFGKCEVVMVNDRRLYVGYRRHGFRIFELPDVEAARADGTTPTLRLVSTALRNRSRLRDMVTSGPLVVTANEEVGVDAFDVTNPAQPRLVSEYQFRGEPILAQGIALYRGYIYVAGWDGGLLVFR